MEDQLGETQGMTVQPNPFIVFNLLNGPRDRAEIFVDLLQADRAAESSFGSVIKN